MAEFPEAIREGRSKYVAGIDKHDGSEVPKEWETQLSAAFNETQPSYRVPLTIHRTKPIQLKASHTAGSSSKEAHIERDFGTCPIGLDTPQFQASREEQTLRQGQIVSCFQHQLHKAHVGYQGSGRSVDSAAQDRPMGRIEETIAGIVLQLRKLHEQGVVLSDILLSSRQCFQIHIAKIVATKIH